MDKFLPYIAQQTSLPDAAPPVEAVTTTPATPPPGGEGFLGSLGNFTPMLMMALVFVLFYFLMIRPQRKEEKRKQEMQTGLKKGDTVVTTSGLVASVATVKEDTVILNVDGTRMEFLRSAVGSVRNTDEKTVKAKSKN